MDTKQDFADHLKTNMTPAERLLWKHLEPLGFLSQEVVRGYIPDFIHYPSCLIIEVDGGYHNTRAQRKKDVKRSRHLNKAGYQVIRFPNEIVEAMLPWVVDRIRGRMAFDWSRCRRTGE